MFLVGAALIVIVRFGKGGLLGLADRIRIRLGGRGEADR